MGRIGCPACERIISNQLRDTWNCTHNEGCWSSDRAPIDPERDIAEAKELLPLGYEVILSNDRNKLVRRIADLERLINNPATDDFDRAVALEAAHQVERWGCEHDFGKNAWDWYWLIGALGSKAVHALITSDRKKALHHMVTVAAVCRNWFQQTKEVPVNSATEDCHG